MTRYTLASLRQAAPRRGHVVPRHPNPALEAWYRQLHAQILGEQRPVSGRAGRYVYYWAYGRLCWRAYVVPKDPRTAVQRRSRAAFGAASKAWSESRLLTQDRRAAWRAAAATIKSAPRLGQSGRLSGQQGFVGQNSVKERWGLPLLLEPADRGRQKAEGLRQKQESAALAAPTLGTSRACPAPAQLSSPPTSAPGNVTIGTRCPSQVQFPQRLTRPSSDRFHTASVALPLRCRWEARTPGSPRCSPTLPQIHRTARFRELWRGG